jgi:hypothetical protein
MAAAASAEVTTGMTSNSTRSFHWIHLLSAFLEEHLCEASIFGGHRRIIGLIAAGSP